VPGGKAVAKDEDQRAGCRQVRDQMFYLAGGLVSIAAQLAANDALARSASAQDSQTVRPGTGRLKTDKVMNMTATQQPGNPLTRWAKRAIRTLQHFNKVLAGI
jgi:hypothetical protein